MSDRIHHCTEFSRSSLMHRAAAEAGRGLPVIEPGMPLPAGTGLDRRTFLSRAAGTALTVYGATRLGSLALDDGIAAAAAERSAGARTLISIFLPGGADGLSVLYPAGDPRYHRLRPNIALKPQDGIPFGPDSRLHWHPSLKPMQQLHALGRVTAIPAIGYTHPDQSHFTSRHFWEVGALDVNLRTGWLGRMLDIVGSAENPLQGLSLDSQLQPPLASAKTPISNLASPGDYRFESQGVWDVKGILEDAVGGFGNQASDPDPWVAAAARTAADADGLRRRLARFLDKDGNPRVHTPASVKYPDGDFAGRLRNLAAMLGAGFPITAVALSAPGGYDTHADEAGPLADGLKQVADALFAFQHDIEARRLGNRVLTLVWSEFGRRAAENASAGTDHGAAGTAFLIGRPVRYRMLGEFPGLAKGLDQNGNLRETVDFRAVYASLLEQWFDVDATQVLPDARRMPRYKLVRV